MGQVPSIQIPSPGEKQLEKTLIFFCCQSLKKYSKRSEKTEFTLLRNFRYVQELKSF